MFGVIKAPTRHLQPGRNILHSEQLLPNATERSFLFLKWTSCLEIIGTKKMPQKFAEPCGTSASNSFLLVTPCKNQISSSRCFRWLLHWLLKSSGSEHSPLSWANGKEVAIQDQNSETGEFHMETKKKYARNLFEEKHLSFWSTSFTDTCLARPKRNPWRSVRLWQSLQ